MNGSTGEQQFLIMTLILSENQCQKIDRIFKEKDVHGGIKILGKGTVKSAALKLFGIKSQKQIIMSFLVEKEKEEKLLDFFVNELHLNRHGHGIVYTTAAVTADRIVNSQQGTLNIMQEREAESMYKKLTVIVNRGMAEDVMDIARKAGATGGTILRGRGTASEMAVKLLGMEIEPEKELVMILLPSDLTEKVVNTLYNELKLDIPGNGVLFVESVLSVHGLFDSASDKNTH